MLRQSTTRNLMIYMTQSADHITGLTGATLTISLSKAGGAFATITPTVTERGNGWYSLALTTAHTDTLGDFVLRITAAGGDPTDLREEVVSALPGESVTVGGFSAGAITTASFAAGAINVTVAPNLDAAVSSRLATAGYTAPDNAGITTLTSRLTAGRATNLDNLDATISSRLASASYVAPANADITAIRAKTDQITFTVANRVDVNTRLINGAAVLGNGTAGDLWRG